MSPHYSFIHYAFVLHSTPLDVDDLRTGKIKEPNQAMEVGKGAMSAIQAYSKKDMGGVFKAGMDIFKVASGGQTKAAKKARETKGSEADVVSILRSSPTVIPLAAYVILPVFMNSFCRRSHGAVAKIRRRVRMPSKPARRLVQCPTRSSPRWTLSPARRINSFSSPFGTCIFSSS